jgi:gliding motility-associated-like protein
MRITLKHIILLLLCIATFTVYAQKPHVRNIMKGTKTFVATPDDNITVTYDWYINGQLKEANTVNKYTYTLDLGYYFVAATPISNTTAHGDSLSVLYYVTETDPNDYPIKVKWASASYKACQNSASEHAIVSVGVQLDGYILSPNEKYSITYSIDNGDPINKEFSTISGSFNVDATALGIGDHQFKIITLYTDTISVDYSTSSNQPIMVVSTGGVIPQIYEIDTLLVVPSLTYIVNDTTITYKAFLKPGYSATSYNWSVTPALLTSQNFGNSSETSVYWHGISGNKYTLSVTPENNGCFGDPKSILVELYDKEDTSKLPLHPSWDNTKEIIVCADPTGKSSKVDLNFRVNVDPEDAAIIGDIYSLRYKVGDTTILSPYSYKIGQNSVLSVKDGLLGSKEEDKDYYVRILQIVTSNRIAITYNDANAPKIQVKVKGIPPIGEILSIKQPINQLKQSVCSTVLPIDYSVSAWPGTMFSWKATVDSFMTDNTNDTVLVVWKLATAMNTLSVVGTFEGCSTETKQITVTILQNPTLNLEPSNIVLCQGDKQTIFANADKGSLTWFNGSKELEYVAASTEVVWAKKVEGICYVVDTSIVTVYPRPIVDLGNDTSLCGDAKLTLLAGNPAATYNWSTGETGGSISIASSEKSVWLKVTYSYSGLECSAADTVLIGVCDIVFDENLIPGAIIPNSDNVENRIWTIPGLLDYPNVVVTIYDRSGRLVYTSEKGYPKPWDGATVNGPAIMDSYFYIINFNKSGKDPKRGIVTVVR